MTDDKPWEGQVLDILDHLTDVLIKQARYIVDLSERVEALENEKS